MEKLKFIVVEAENEHVLMELDIDPTCLKMATFGHFFNYDGKRFNCDIELELKGEAK
jgi:hypothetical protein